MYRRGDSGSCFMTASSTSRTTYRRTLMTSPCTNTSRSSNTPKLTVIPKSTKKNVRITKALSNVRMWKS